MSGIMPRSRGSPSFVAAMMVVSSVFFLVASPAFAARGLSQAVGILPMPSTKETMWEVSKAGDPKDPSVTRNVIVRLKTGDGVIESNGDVDAKAARTLSRITSLAGVMSVETLSKRAGIHKLELDKSASVDKIMAKMTRWKHVLSAEQDQIVTIDDFDPNDPYYVSGQLYGIDKVNSPAVWAANYTGSKDVVVCVIDTGVDYNHPDLVDNMWRNPGETGLDNNGNDKATNGIDDDNNGVIDGTCPRYKCILWVYLLYYCPTFGFERIRLEHAEYMMMTLMVKTSRLMIMSSRVLRM